MNIQFIQAFLKITLIRMTIHLMIIFGVENFYIKDYRIKNKKNSFLSDFKDRFIYTNKIFLKKIVICQLKLVLL
jgi:hypothetical protein